MTQPIFRETLIVSAPSFVNHDLPLENSENIMKIKVKRRTQNRRQFPDHTHFAGRPVLVDQSSPTFKTFSFCGGHRTPLRPHLQIVPPLI